VCVLVICVLVFTVFCTVCTVFLYCSVYVYLFLFVLSVPVYGLLPPSDTQLHLVLLLLLIILREIITIFVTNDSREANKS